MNPSPNPEPDESTTAPTRPHAPQSGFIPKSNPNHQTKVTASEKSQGLEQDLHDLQKAHDNAQRDLSFSSRENRDQSLELRDLKRRLAKLQEQNTQLREQNGLLREAYQASQARGGDKLSKGDKHKYHEHYEMLENHISHLQHERHKRETHMEFLTEQTREANDGKERLEAEARKLQRQMRDLSANLTECKDDLLRLQPASQISDHEIAEQFSNLDQQIAGWVDDKTEDATALEEKMGSIKTVDDLPEPLRMFATAEHLRLAKKYPDAQPLLLRYFIHCYLQTFVLSSDVYLFGLDERNVALLQGMEEGMKQLEPRRGIPHPHSPSIHPSLTLRADEKTLRNWRTETLRGLLQMPTFLTSQTHHAALATSTLSHALSSLLPPSSTTSDLYAQIIQPSLHLANTLRLSSSDYRLLFRPFARDSEHARTAYQHEVAHSSMMDVATHKMIRADSAVKAAEDGRIGEEVLVVCPALVRALRDGKGRVVVCKATVLVKLDEPMGKRARSGMMALGAWTPGWLGGGGGGGGDGVE